MRRLLLCFLLWHSLVVSNLHVVLGGVDYGVDVSWPMQYNVIHDHPEFVGRQKIFDDFMEGCRTHYSEDAKRCDFWDKERLDMNLRQPQSMVNYTDTGFMKTKAPESVMTLVRAYWQENRHNNKTEVWPKGYTFTNHWESPTYMVSVEDQSLSGGGMQLKAQIWKEVKHVIEEWTGQEQVPCSLYGIRVYTEGSVLAPHVDRLPLVGSAILNVDQDVDEPWPLEVIDRDGVAMNITMEPGDLVLYESHSLIHGRPFNLKGRYFANIFIHFEPTGRPLDRKDDPTFFDTLDADLPPYIIPGSLEHTNWMKENPDGWKLQKERSNGVGKERYQAHRAALHGDLVHLSKLAKHDENLIHEKDENGWQPLHEAVRAGHRDVIDYLLRKGANINERTHFGRGESPLRLARKMLHPEHPLVGYIESIGGEDFASEL